MFEKEEALQENYRPTSRGHDGLLLIRRNENPITKIIKERTCYLPTYIRYKEPDGMVLHVYANMYVSI